MEEFWRRDILMSPFMTVGGDMLNEKYREVRRATIAELRQPRHVDACPERRAKAFAKRPRHLADRCDLRKTENDDFAIQTFTLPLEAARLKVREILNHIPQRGHLEIVERWRQLPDGQIELTMRRLLTSD
jgi:hypothetical protein